MKLTTLAKLLLPLALAGSASAASFTWAYSTTTVPLDFLQEGADESHGGDFDITFTSSLNPVAYNPSLHLITEATVYFAFADDKNGIDVTSSSSTYDIAESVDISVGGTKLWDNLQVDGIHDNAPANYHWVSMTLPAGLLNSLKDDGKISYLVQIQNLVSNTGGYDWKKEDTYLKVAALVATGTDIPPPPVVTVPDGGSTLVLLGLVILGLAAGRKSFRR